MLPEQLSHMHCKSGYFPFTSSSLSPYYSGIILNAFGNLLFSKLFQHNRLRPIPHFRLITKIRDLPIISQCSKGNCKQSPVSLVLTYAAWKRVVSCKLVGQSRRKIPSQLLSQTTSFLFLQADVNQCHYLKYLYGIFISLSMLTVQKPSI